MLYLSLNAPASVALKNEAEVSAVKRYHEAKRLRLGKTKRKKLEQGITRLMDEWEGGTGPLHEKLSELADFFEGKPEDIDFPFGAGQSSNLDTRYCVAQARTLRASFIRAVFGDPIIFTAKNTPGAKRSKELNDIESAVNWAAFEDTNAAESLKETLIPGFRDGLALVHGEWERRVELGTDYKVYQTAEDFMADYPDAKAAGLSDEEFENAVGYLATFPNEVHVEYETEFVAQNGPRFRCFPLYRFIWAPLFAKEMRDLELYGYHFKQSGLAFDGDAASGYYDEEAVEKARKTSGQEHSLRDDDESRDLLDGIDSSGTEDATYQLAKLVFVADLDKDGTPERYSVIWDVDAKCALRIEPYCLRRNVPNIVAFRLSRRNGRFIGDSILKDGLDLYRELNALHRHRSNVRRLTDSVTLMLPMSLKEDADLGAEYAFFKPGMTLWIPDAMFTSGKTPAQLALQNLSRTNDSMDEEQLVMRYLDMESGITQGQSGRETSIDPSAPASKTRMLLARADLRVDDLVAEWANSIPDFVDLLRGLYAANAPSKMAYMARAKGELTEKEVPMEIVADPKIRFALKSSRYESQPETEMNKIMGLMVSALKLQFPAQAKPEMLPALWDDYVVASRTADPDRFLIGHESQAGGAGGIPPQLQQALAQLLGGMNANAKATSPQNPQRPGQPPVNGSRLPLRGPSEV